jgi:hypothetical protein
VTNFYVLCPGNSVTGGPELIHQFVDVINNQGGSASILYYPFENDFSIPDAYKNYNVKVTKYNDNFSKNFTDVIIVPEVATRYISLFKGKKVFIWWLSIDNYFKPTVSTIVGKIKYVIKKVIKHKSLPVKLTDMKDYGHLVQSYYAKTFLENYGYQSLPLSDYLNENHLNQDIDLQKKKNIICYNPKKGVAVTDNLKNNHPNFTFKAIENMKAKQVSELLSESKIYIDFGEHPGKDRIPREAAMAKCVVITGVKGSAKNKYDIEVPDKYKVDESLDAFITTVGELISDTFENYEVNLLDFTSYIEKIEKEKDVFQEQVYQFLLNENK